MANFTTRPAKPEDAEAMVHLQRLAVEKAWRPIVKNNFDAFLAERFDTASQIKKYRERISDPARILIIVENEPRLAGFGGGRQQEADEQPKGYAYQANAFYLDPTFEGSGASLVLLGGLKEELVKRNATSICAWCLADNRLARNFYEKRGGKLIADAITPAEYNEVAPHVAYGWNLK
jgi:hypothetical protein